MTPRTRRADPRPRGFTLLEGVIALSVLVIGLVGALSTISFGANSDRAARAQTLATVAAQELLSALNALPPVDSHLSVNTSSATAPAAFGPLLSGYGSINTTGSHLWSDTDPIAGVRTDVQLATGPEGGLEMQRRWTVWDYTPPGMPGGSIVRLISVSVIYRDPTLREVVVYGERPDLGALLVRVFTTG